jgi:CubicO group peptidase (beta-lactamase class C family)
MVVSTAHDVAIWLGAILDGMDGKDGILLTGESIKEMVRPHAREAPDRDYALGWTIRTVHGVLVADHGGSVITMGSHFILAPEHHVGVAVLANSSTSATEIVAEGVLALLSGREPERSFPNPGRRAPLDVIVGRRLSGLYVAESPSNGLSSPLSIEYTGDGLRALTYPGGPHHPPGDVHFAPIEGEGLDFLLFGRGKTGTEAHFDLDGDTVRLIIGNVALRQVAAQCHRGTIVRWSGSGKDAK